MFDRQIVDASPAAILADPDLSRQCLEVARSFIAVTARERVTFDRRIMDAPSDQVLADPELMNECLQVARAFVSSAAKQRADRGNTTHI
jgi:hypothetical protein